MRIVGKEEFMSMPRYTVFAETDGVDGPLVGQLCVRGATIGRHAYRYTPLDEIATAGDGASLVPSVEKMARNSDISFPGALVEKKRAGIPDDARFLVYGRHEINQMIDLLRKAVRRLDRIDARSDDKTEEDEV